MLPAFDGNCFVGIFRAAAAGGALFIVEGLPITGTGTAFHVFLNYATVGSHVCDLYVSAYAAEFGGRRLLRTQ